MSLALASREPPASRHTARRANHTKTISTADRCATYLIATRSYNDFAVRVSAAYDVARKAVPMPTELVDAVAMPEFSHLADIGHVFTHHVAAAVNYLETSQTRKTGDDKDFVIEFRKGGFPLTAKQKARLRELKALLEVARKYDADFQRALDKSGHTALEAELTEMGDALYRLRCRMIKSRVNTAADLNGKYAVWRVDPCEDLAADIIEAAARLIAAEGR